MKNKCSVVHPFCSVVLRSDPCFFVVLRYDLQCSGCSGIIRGAPGVIRCSVSAPSTIRSSITAGPLVSVLLDAFSAELSSLCHIQ